MKKTRMDYVLIWSHGIQYVQGIMDIIRSYEDIDIVTIVAFDVEDISKFVWAVYSTDTYPMQHLIDKTAYLMHTEPEVIFILLRNRNTQEKESGSGEFRGVQCQLIEKLKWEIRGKYNPRDKNGQDTHNHVIHVSDFESQVVHILKLLRLPDIKYYNRIPNKDLDLPHHIQPFDSYSVEEIDIDNIYAYITDVDKCKLEDTPHFEYLNGNKQVYVDYYNKYFATILRDDHMPGAFDHMIKDFKYNYISDNGRRSIALVTKSDDCYIVEDGVHRLAILKHRNVKFVKVAVI